MARANKITITITEARRSATISWRATGSSGSLILSQESGSLPNGTLPPGTSVKAYWADVLNQVLPNLS